MSRLDLEGIVFPLLNKLDNTVCSKMTELIELNFHSFHFPCKLLFPSIITPSPRTAEKACQGALGRIK